MTYRAMKSMLLLLGLHLPAVNQKIFHTLSATQSPLRMIAPRPLKMTAPLFTHSHLSHRPVPPAWHLTQMVDRITTTRRVLTPRMNHLLDQTTRPPTLTCHLTNKTNETSHPLSKLGHPLSKISRALSERAIP